MNTHAASIASLGAGALLALAAGPAAAQGQMRYPPGVIARGVALTAACRAAGGTVVNGPRPFLVVQHDLTGDGRREFILDEAAFACSSAGYRAAGPAGAPVEVFDGASGTSLYRGVAAGWQVLAGARPQVMLTLRGNVCGPNALATTTCQRPLVWNAQARALTGPQGPLNRPAGAAAPPPQAAPPQPAAGSMTLTEADKAAAFRALGFKQVGRLWKRCEEETPTASYSPGAIEEVLDLNGDGRPEAVVTEAACSATARRAAGSGSSARRRPAPGARCSRPTACSSPSPRGPTAGARSWPAAPASPTRSWATTASNTSGAGTSGNRGRRPPCGFPVPLDGLELVTAPPGG